MRSLQTPVSPLGEDESLSTGPAVSREDELSTLRADQSRPTLRLGASGPEVEELQRALNLIDPKNPIKVDGDFGSKTRTAVITFQSANNLNADGVVGPKTWSAIESQLRAVSNPKEELPSSAVRLASAAQIVEFSSTFRRGISLVFHWEGGLSDDPDDRGNRGGNVTNLGVTQPAYDSFRTNNGLPTQSVRAITKNEAQQLYYEQYYVAAKCDLLAGERTATAREAGEHKLPTFSLDKVAIFQLDTAVNMGPKAAACILQEALLRCGESVSIDGKIGPQTLSALTNVEQSEILSRCFEVREEFYRKIARRDPSNEKFLNGWMNRLDGLRNSLTPIPVLSAGIFRGEPGVSIEPIIKQIQKSYGLNPNGEIDSETFDLIMHPERATIAEHGRLPSGML